MHQKRVKVKQLKGGRHNGQFAVITYDQPETDPTVQERVENEVTVAICRHATLAKVVEDHFRKLFAGLAGTDAPGQASETRGDLKETAGVTFGEWAAKQPFSMVSPEADYAEQAWIAAGGRL